MARLLIASVLLLWGAGCFPEIGERPEFIPPADAGQTPSESTADAGSQAPAEKTDAGGTDIPSKPFDAGTDAPGPVADAGVSSGEIGPDAGPGSPEALTDAGPGSPEAPADAGNGSSDGNADGTGDGTATVDAGTADGASDGNSDGVPDDITDGGAPDEASLPVEPSFVAYLDGEYIHGGTLDAAMVDALPIQPWIHTDSTTGAQSADWQVDYIEITSLPDDSLLPDGGVAVAGDRLFYEPFDDLTDWSVIHKGGVGAISTSGGILYMTSDYNQIRHNDIGANLGNAGFTYKIRFYQGTRSAGLFLRARQDDAVIVDYQPKQIWGGKGANWTEPELTIYGAKTFTGPLPDGWHTLEVRIDPGDHQPISEITDGGSLDGMSFETDGGL